MRKIITTSFILIVLSGILNSAELAINPFPGAFGVDMGSGKYMGICNHVGKGVSVNSPGYDPAQGYTDDHMIAIGGLWKITDEGEASQEIKVSVHIGNDFAFRSQIGEGAVRPLGIGIIPKIRAGVDHYRIEWFETVYDHTEYNEADVREYKPTILYQDGDFTFSFMGNIPDKMDEGAGLLREAFWDIWFDIILVLPYDGMEYGYIERPVSSTGILSYNGREYALVQADDYSALVTITVTTSQSDEILTVIPFSGYYSGNEKGKRDAVANLYVNPKARAANLSIENDHGNRVGVADINFMASGGRTEINPDFRIFLSSSNDSTLDQGEFLLVHEDVVSREEPVIGQNAIKYTAYLMPDSKTSPNLNHGRNGIGFDGKSFIAGNSINGSYTDVVHIYNSDTGEPVSYYMYSGEIQVEIDEPVSVMESGRYTSEIFIHVVDLGV